MDNPWASSSWDHTWTADDDTIISDHPSTTETNDGNVSSVSREEDDWGTTWTTTSTETQPPSQWEKENLNRAVPSELLQSLLLHCQQVSQEIWPASETKNEDNWRSGFDNHAEIVALFTQLLPPDLTSPPPVQFSATATAKAMNEALKQTRHLPASSSSPLSRLLASKGPLEWEKAVRVKEHVVRDTTHVGWKVLEKEDRLSVLEESKSRRLSGGLLSFWNRRASGIQAAPAETPSERPGSPARISQESVHSVPHPPSLRAASPSKASVTSVPPPPPTDTTVTGTVPAPSAVSRFLNRFSRTRGAQHSALALSSDDLEFLSDIVPSASDPPDDVNNYTALDALGYSSPFLQKLPPPIPPPPKQPNPSSHPHSTLVSGTMNSKNIGGSTLIPPISLATPTIVSGQSSTLSAQPTFQPSSQLSPPSQSSPLPSPPKTLPLLSIPPLLPPPPVSPPQTPRPNAFSSMMRSVNASSCHDPYDPDDEFAEFKSFPPASEPYPPQVPPSPPSPPPRRSYGRTHYPSSPSVSSIISPASQSSLDHLYPTRSSISASLDSFDDFVSPPPRGENRKRTPSPPPLPVKHQLQHQQPPRLDTLGPRIYHVHSPSQTLASPTVHTSLMNGIPPVPSVSDAEHRRTQTLVNIAAARGGVWPNSPDLDEPKVKAIPPPPSASASPKPLIGQESFDLLGDNDVFAGLEALPPLHAAVKGSRVSSPSADASRVPFAAASGPGKGLGLRNQLQHSPQPVPCTPPPIFSFSSLSSLGTSVPLPATHPTPSQPTRPKQTGGLSAQDLSFFEGL